MKALQELIPRCNKVCLNMYPSYSRYGLVILIETFCSASTLEQTDKASMLEDAIEYVKSLQMQIQVCTPK